MRHFQHRKDDNQRGIERDLEQRGMSVVDIHNGPIGDLLVGYQGVNYLFEIKDENKPASRRKLTPKQEDLVAAWRGQLAVVKNSAEALAVIYGREDARYGADEQARRDGLTAVVEAIKDWDCMVGNPKPYGIAGLLVKATSGDSEFCLRVIAEKRDYLQQAKTAGELIARMVALKRQDYSWREMESRAHKFEKDPDGGIPG